MQFRLATLAIVVALALLICGHQPAQAAGICSDDNRDVTTIILKSNSGYELRFNLWRDGDKVRGKMQFNPHPGDFGGEGSVDGQFDPDNRKLSLQVFLYPPAPPGTKILISGSFWEGAGWGELRETDWDADVKNHRWSARTLEGCPKWPNGPYPPIQMTDPVEKLAPDPCDMLAKGRALASTMGMAHPCNVRMDSNRAETLKELVTPEPMPTETLFPGIASAPTLPAGAFPCRADPPRATSDSDIVRQIYLPQPAIRLTDCPPAYPRNAALMRPDFKAKVLSTMPKPPAARASPPQRSGSGATAARGPQGSSGASTVSGNPALERLTGDGMGGASSTPQMRMPDGVRGPTQQGGATTPRGSSGASTASGQPRGSSGASMPAGGPGVKGTFEPRTNSRPFIEMYRPPEQKPTLVR